MLKTSESSSIFVFGSNLAGRHGKGAALTAMLHFSAVRGQGEGLQGSSYAIPTKDANLRILLLSEIKGYVDTFLAFARRNPKIRFNVTAIGTGLAGYSHDDIAPMFFNAPLNCVLPIKWKEIIPKEGRTWWRS